MTFRLAHFSDPHLPPPAGALGWKDLASKRALSGVAWRRKGREHRPAILAALVADVRAQNPDHIALTGDITNFSSETEYAAAQDWLASLGEPSRLTLSPGNHDALVGEADAQRFAPWARWLGDETTIAFPMVRERGPVALINLCSATPTAPWLATGRLGDDQLARLDRMLEGLEGRDLFRVLMLHHPAARGVVSGRKSLEDAEALRAVLARRGVDLVLHGHGHEAAVSTIPGPTAPIPVLGVPSASAAGEHSHPPARWHMIEFHDAPRRVRVSARGLTPTGGFEDLGSYWLDAAQR